MHVQPHLEHCGCTPAEARLLVDSLIDWRLFDECGAPATPRSRAETNEEHVSEEGAPPDGEAYSGGKVKRAVAKGKRARGAKAASSSTPLRDA